MYIDWVKFFGEKEPGREICTHLLREVCLESRVHWCHCPHVLSTQRLEIFPGWGLNWLARLVLSPQTIIIPPVIITKFGSVSFAENHSRYIYRGSTNFHTTTGGCFFQTTSLVQKIGTTSDCQSLKLVGRVFLQIGWAHWPCNSTGRKTPPFRPKIPDSLRERDLSFDQKSNTATGCTHFRFLAESVVVSRHYSKLSEITN